MLGKNSKDKEATRPKSVTGRAANPDTSVIGKGMAIKGDVETDGHLRIEGKVSGDVRAQVLEVTNSGAVSGDIAGPRAGKHDQLFVIAGRVTGTVRASRVEVRGSGAVLGGIEADDATIQGGVEGGITVRGRLSLAATAIVEGEVRALRLSMEEGGQVNGTIHMGEQAAIETKGTDAEEIAEKARERGGDKKREGALTAVSAGAA